MWLFRRCRAARSLIAVVLIIQVIIFAVILSHDSYGSSSSTGTGHAPGILQGKAGTKRMRNIGVVEGRQRQFGAEHYAAYAPERNVSLSGPIVFEELLFKEYEILLNLNRGGNGKSPISSTYRGTLYAERNDYSSKYGNLGQGVSVEWKKNETVYKEDAARTELSDLIGEYRALPDFRNADCRRLKYENSLPNASVVIIFHNEAWFHLIRTIHTVIRRSPPHLLHEIVLVDDFSERSYLVNGTLHAYITRTWPDGVVRLIRTKERSGLIRARLAGATFASGEVLVFLDSHCEVSEGWLEPLLHRVSVAPYAVVCPVIDVISAQDYAFYGGGSGDSSVGGFWWSLHFNWKSPAPSEMLRRKSSADTVQSPTMAGGLFGVNRNFFFNVGAYDPGMDVWGGENLEMSFRVWMCGGSVEIHPCSRVGHVFRDWHPYTFPGQKDTHGLNSRRLAEVWMDDYKRLFYVHRRELEHADADSGDISGRIALRKRLKCHSFKWYLDNVYPDKFVPDEGVLAHGMVMNRMPDVQWCLDTLGRDEKYSLDLAIYDCQNGASANQVMSLTNDGQLRRESLCLGAFEGQTSDGRAEPQVTMGECLDRENNGQRWKYIHDTKQIQWLTLGESAWCLDTDGLHRSSTIKLHHCYAHRDSQKWTFENAL